MISLAILFGCCILIWSSDFAAIHGRFAQELELPGAWLIPYGPWLVLAGFVLAVILVRRIQSPLRRWLSFTAAVLVATFIAPVPVWLLRRGSVAIPLPHRLSKEQVMTLKAAYPVKWVIYSSSMEGDCLRVSRRDYRPEMTAFAQALAATEKTEAE